MPTPFGPQLVGETEKTLGALLRRILDGTGLSEPQWVTLRLADLLEGQVDPSGFSAAVADRAHFADADELVADLSGRGLLADGRLTAAGRQLLTDTQARAADLTGPIWRGFPDADVAATTRVLNEVVARGRALLA